MDDMTGTEKTVRLERARDLIQEARRLVDGLAPTAHEQLAGALAVVNAVLGGRR